MKAHNTPWVRRGVLLLLLLCFLVSGGAVLRITLQTKQTEAAVEDIRAQYRSTVIEEIVPTEETEKEEVSQSVGLQALRDKNPDCVGWITIAGTRVDYPVMQSSVKDAERYLRRNFQGEYDINGLPFLDARCTVSPASQNLIVYGHNMHTGVMFHDLLSYKKQEYAQEHPTIFLETLEGSANYGIAAVFIYDAANSEENFRPHHTLNFDQENWNSYVRELETRRLYDTGVTLEEGDSLLTLITCDRSRFQEGRLIVVAKKLVAE